MQVVMSETVPIVDAESPPPKRSWPLRFSLSSLCVVVAIASVAAAWYGMRKREQAAVEKAATLAATVKTQQAEISRLRGELGYLTIDDRSKVHVLQLVTRDDFHWKWRVYLPPGKKWALCSGLGDIPLRGYQNVRSGWSSIPDGEYTIEVYFDRDDEGQRRFVIRRNEGKTSMSVEEAKFQQLKAAGHSTISAGSSKTHTLEPVGPIQLIRLRQHRELPSNPPGTRSFGSSDDPASGFVVWLE